MATKKPSTADVKEGIYAKCCTLCNQEMSQSKILPCVHALCVACLEDTRKMRNKGCGDKMPCPVCDNEFTIPLEGLAALERNVFIQELVGALQSVDSRHKRCDACYKDKDADDSVVIENRIVAENYCLVCQQKLCEECLEHHRRFTTTREHHVIGINCDRLSDCGRSDLPSFCERHMLQLRLYYCAECEKVLCETCFQESHQNHRMQDVNMSSENSKTEIQNIIEDLSAIESEVSINNEKLDKERTSSLAHLDGLRTEIERSGDKLKELIDEQVCALLRHVDSIEEKKKSETRRQKEANQRFAASLAHFSSCCSEILTMASADEICWAMSKLKLRACELREQQLNITKSRSPALSISFQTPEPDCFAKRTICNMLGQIKVNHFVAQKKRKFLEHDVSEDQHGVCNNQLRKICETKTVSADRVETEISAMAILNEELFLATSRSSSVEVHDILTLSLRRRWSATTNIATKIHDVDDIRSMGSCSRNDSLYILHYKSTKTCEILRTDVCGQTIAHWTTKYGHSLSVTEEGNVVVIDYWANKLKEYRPDGQLVRKYNLSKFQGIIHPYHAIKLSNGHFVVCHGLNSDQLHRVCVVDTDGCQMRSFGECKGPGMDQLYDPFHLALGVDGCVLVADWKNGRVLELNSDLRCAREVLTKEHGLRFPRCICLDVHAGRLFVADDQLKTCLVFDNKQTLDRH